MLIRAVRKPKPSPSPCLPATHRRRRRRLAAIASFAAILAAPAGALAAGPATISGRVYAQTGGQGVAGALVCLDRTEASGTHRCQTTNANGEYTIEGVAPGTYIPEAYCEFEAPCEPANVIGEYYGGVALPEQATTVRPQAGQTLSHVDFPLATGARIVGHVTRPDGTELQGIPVCARARDATDSSLGSWQCTLTNGEGDYSLEGLASGEYVVSFTAGNFCYIGCEAIDYVGQYYKSASTPSQATLVDMKAGETRVSVNAKLAPGGEVTGTVTDPTGKPISEAEVCAVGIEGTVGGDCVSTQPSGAYTLVGLSGSYRIAFEHPWGSSGAGLADVYYPGTTNPATATTVHVNPGATVTSVSGKLVVGGEIRGRVTSAITGQPVDGVGVCARPVGDSSEALMSCFTTNENGEYALGGISGVYAVDFEADIECLDICMSTHYLNEYWTEAFSEATATPVVVEGGAVRGGVDLQVVESPSQTPGAKAAQKHAEEQKQAEERARATQLAREAQETTSREEQERKKREAQQLALLQQQRQRIIAAVLGHVHVGRIAVRGRRLLVDVTATVRATISISGPALGGGNFRLRAGAHVLALRLTSSGRAAAAKQRVTRIAVLVRTSAGMTIVRRTVRL